MVGIVDLLGIRFGEPAVTALLDSYGVARKPTVDEKRPLGWIPINRFGVELGFEDEAYFRAWPLSMRGRTPLVLTNVIFYNEREDMAPFEGTLPEGLRWTDSRSSVRTILTENGWSAREYTRDVFDRDDVRLIAAYRPDDRLESLVVKQLRAPWPECVELEFRGSPDLSAIHAAFGHNLDAPPFASIFPMPLVRERLDELRLEKSISFMAEAGYELYFQSAKRLRLPARVGAGLVFAAIRLHSDRDLDARGWRGDLPCGLKFTDSPTDIFSKMRVAPADGEEEFTTGWGVWHLELYSVQLLYSTYENRLLRVFLMAPGYWESLDCE